MAVSYHLLAWTFCQPACYLAEPIMNANRNLIEALHSYIVNGLVSLVQTSIEKNRALFPVQKQRRLAKSVCYAHPEIRHKAATILTQEFSPI